MGKARKPPPAWAVRLRAEREARFWSQKEMARQLYEAAPPEVQSTFPSRASVMRELRDWEAGRWKPGSRYKRLYALAFGIDESVLFGDTFKLPGKSPEEVLATILPGSDSLAPLATRAGRRIGETTIEDLAARVHSMRWPTTSSAVRTLSCLRSANWTPLCASIGRLPTLKRLGGSCWP